VKCHSGLGDEYVLTNIFKPNIALRDVMDLGALIKDLTKEDNAVIVDGPGNSYESDFNYQTEIDLDNTIKNSYHANVGFLGFLGHDRPHMNRWVMSVNMRLELVLWIAGKTHISLTAISPLDSFHILSICIVAL
jgi:hypothetical protein